MHASIHSSTHSSSHLSRRNAHENTNFTLHFHIVEIELFQEVSQVQCYIFHRSSPTKSSADSENGIRTFLLGLQPFPKLPLSSLRIPLKAEANPSWEEIIYLPRRHTEWPFDNCDLFFPCEGTEWLGDWSRDSRRISAPSSSFSTYSIAPVSYY